MREQTGDAAARHQPADVELGCLLGVLAKCVPDLRHRHIAGGKPGVGRHHAGEAISVLGDEAQPDQTAPVVTHEGDVTQLQLLDQAAHPVHVALIGVVFATHRLVGAAEADQVGSDHPVAGGGDDRHGAAVEVRPRGLAVEQQHRGCAGRPFVEVVDPHPVDLDVVWRERVGGKGGEALLRRPAQLQRHHPSGPGDASDGRRATDPGGFSESVRYGVMGRER